MEVTTAGPVTLYTGDVTQWAAEYDGPKFHAALSDPPYGIRFMSRAWDHGVPSAETWAAIAEHLLPGAHLMAFGGDRTFHRLACAIEDAGLEVRRHWAWCHLQGFPKSLDVSKAIDRAAGAVREVVGVNSNHRPNLDAHVVTKLRSDIHATGNGTITAPATPEAAIFSGWGTDTKPALEFITLARKPFRGTVAANCLAHGTGALAIDAARVGVEGGVTRHTVCQGDSNGWHDNVATGEVTDNGGRWPSNLLLDDAGAAMLDRQCPDQRSGGGAEWCGKPDNDGKHGSVTNGTASTMPSTFHDNGGQPSRMFHRVETALDAADPLTYCAKAATSEREAGLDHRKRGMVSDGRKAVNGAGNDNPRLRGATARACQHPTVKPIDLATKLATLLLPPAEYAPRRILVPFSGVCSEVIGCLLAGWDEVVGIELDPEHVSIGADRVRYYGNRVQLALPGFEVAP